MRASSALWTPLVLLLKASVDANVSVMIPAAILMTAANLVIVDVTVFCKLFSVVFIVVITSIHAWKPHQLLSFHRANTLTIRYSVATVDVNLSRAIVTGTVAIPIALMLVEM